MAAPPPDHSGYGHFGRTAPTATCFLSFRLTDLAAAAAEVDNRTPDAGSVAIRLKQTGQLIGDLL